VNTARKERRVTDVLAYIDPGSGSLIIQAVIATVIAVPVFFRHQISRVVDAIRGRKEPVTPGDDRATTD
jgi:hypothetical protein